MVTSDAPEVSGLYPVQLGQILFFEITHDEPMVLARFLAKVESSILVVPLGTTGNGWPVRQVRIKLRASVSHSIGIVQVLVLTV